MCTRPEQTCVWPLQEVTTQLLSSREDGRDSGAHLDVVAMRRLTALSTTLVDVLPKPVSGGGQREKRRRTIRRREARAFACVVLRGGRIIRVLVILASCGVERRPKGGPRSTSRADLPRIA